MKTCDSKNGKRVRGIIAKHNVTALPNKLALCSLPSPLLARIARTMIKEVVYASAARSLASLGSAQLAPRGQKSSQRAQSSPKQFRAAQSSPEQPRTAQSSPEQPRGAAQSSSTEQPRAAQSSPEQPKISSRSAPAERNGLKLSLA